MGRLIYIILISAFVGFLVGHMGADPLEVHWLDWAALVWAIVSCAVSSLVLIEKHNIHD